MSAALLIKTNPFLNVKEIQDQYLRKNFQNLQEYFTKENQLLGFKFIEVDFSGAVTNQKIAHGIGSIPQDVILTRISGPGTIQFNWANFDNLSLDVTTTDACRCRFFVGSYWNFVTAVDNASTDLTQFNALASTSVKSSNNAQVFPTTSITAKSFVSTVNDANNVVLIDGSVGGVLLTLPSLAKARKTGIYSYEKIDSSFNQVTIQVVTGDRLDYAGATSLTLATQGERLEFIPANDRWVVINRVIRSTDIAFTPVLTTNAQANAVTLNTGAAFFSPFGVWRREGSRIRLKFGFQNGNGAATGTNGPLSISIPTPNPDPTQSFTGGNPSSNPPNDGLADVMAGTSQTGVTGLALTVGTPGFFQIKRLGTGSTFYALSDLVASFGVRGELLYAVQGWGA